MSRAKLTDKQKCFVEEYLVDLNATQAAIRAGYKPKAAYATGAENLRKPQIAEALQEALKARAARTAITADRVIKELGRVAFSNMKTFASWGDGGVVLVKSDDLDEDATACVAEVTETTTTGGGDEPWSRTEIKFKLHRKEHALESLGRHFGIFELAKFEHERQLAEMKGKQIEAAIRDLPATLFFEYDENGKPPPGIEEVSN